MTGTVLASERAPRWVVTVAISGTLLLALGAFWLSFLSLQDLAYRSGLPAQEAWVWPLIVDGVIVEATVAVVSLRHAASSRARAFGWLLLAAGSGVSVAANVTHAIVEADARVPGMVAAIVSAVPPLVLLAMTHLTVLLAQGSASQEALRESAVAQPPRGNPTKPPQKRTLPGARKISTTPGLHGRAIELHRQGVPAAQISRELGVHRTTITRWLLAPDPDEATTPAPEEPHE